MYFASHPRKGSKLRAGIAEAASATARGGVPQSRRILERGTTLK